MYIFNEQAATFDFYLYILIQKLTNHLTHYMSLGLQIYGTIPYNPHHIKCSNLHILKHCK